MLSSDLLNEIRKTCRQEDSEERSPEKKLKQTLGGGGGGGGSHGRKMKMIVEAGSVQVQLP